MVKYGKNATIHTTKLCNKKYVTSRKNKQRAKSNILRVMRKK